MDEINLGKVLDTLNNHRCMTDSWLAAEADISPLRAGYCLEMLKEQGIFIRKAGVYKRIKTISEEELEKFFYKNI